MDSWETRRERMTRARERERKRDRVREGGREGRVGDKGWRLEEGVFFGLKH